MTTFLLNHRGFGDTLHHSLTAIGIGPWYLRQRRRWTSKPCRCRQRAEWLNQRIPYDRPPLTIAVPVWSSASLPNVWLTLQSLTHQILAARLERLDRLALLLVCQTDGQQALTDWLPVDDLRRLPFSASLLLPSSHGRAAYWCSAFGRTAGWTLALEPGGLLRPDALAAAYRHILTARRETVWTANPSSGGLLCYAPAWQTAIADEDHPLHDLTRFRGWGAEQRVIAALRAAEMAATCPALGVDLDPFAQPDNEIDTARNLGVIRAARAVS